jgi:S1-C subfamily serine protease
MEVMGSGVVIGRNRILTNAHLVLYADEVSVQCGQGGDQVEAKVAAIGPGIDLAVLSLEDGTVFDRRPPIPQASKVPEITARVAVLGFPVGGTTLSTTQGTVSRIEYDTYETGTAGLRIQVDAAIKPGESGGPAVVDGKMIGIVSGHTENIGYIIPIQEIDYFLADIDDGHYDGKPFVFDQFQPLENEALRARLGLARDVRGLMVREPRHRDPAYPLKEFDILTRIGKHEIDNEGMIQAEENLRLSFLSQVPKLVRDGSVPVSVLRAGKSLSAALPVSREPERLLRSFAGRYPSFFLCGPLVLSPVYQETANFYSQFNRMLASRNSPLTTRRSDRARFPGEELVVVTAPLLRTRMTKGYADPFGQVVSEVNGTKVKNLTHLVDLIESCQDEYLTFRFAEDDAETLVFRRQLMLEATESLMRENDIPRRGSDDVLAVWSDYGNRLSKDNLQGLVVSRGEVPTLRGDAPCPDEPANHAIRQRDAVPLLVAFGEWFEEQSRKVLPKSPIGQASSCPTLGWRRVPRRGAELRRKTWDQRDASSHRIRLSLNVCGRITVTEGL